MKHITRARTSTRAAARMPPTLGVGPRKHLLFSGRGYGTYPREQIHYSINTIRLLALEYYRKSLAIRKQVLGEEHSDVAMTLCNMGMVYYEQENYAKAMEFNRHALGIWERVLGPEHPMLAYPLLMLGNIRARKAEITQALAHYRRALAIREKVLGPEHPFLAEPLRRLGEVLSGSNRPVQALALLQRLITLCEKKTCHTGTHASGLFELARAMLATGKNKTRAIQLAKQARQLFSKTPQASQNDIKMIDLWLQQRKQK